MSDSKTRDDILYAFSIEPNYDRETLERYLRKYPELADDLIDLSHELMIAVALRSKDVGPLPELSREIIGAAIEVHRRLGPGLLESAYRVCLAYELRKRGFQVEEERPVPVIYDDVQLECGAA